MCISAPSTTLFNAGTAFQLGFGLREWLETRGPKVGEGTVTVGQDWQVCGVPSGDYRLDLYGFVRQTVQGVGYGQKALIVGKRNADAGQVEMLGFGSVAGRMKVRGAKPEEAVPEGIRLRLQLRNRDLLPSDTLQGKIARDGTFDLPKVYQDAYGLEIENLPPSHYVAKMEQGLADVKKAGIRPDAGPVAIELARDGPRLSGQVHLSDGEAPAAEATVFLVNRLDESIQIAQSDQSGSYSFDAEIQPGEYKAIAVLDLPESQRRDPQVAQRFLSHAVTVKLSANENKKVALTGRSNH